MGRSKTANENAPAQAVHDDATAARQNRVDLIAYHLARLGPKQVAVAAVKAEVDQVVAEAKERLAEAQQQLTDMFHEAKAETRLERDVLERGLKAQKAGARKAVRDREEWDLVCEAAGIPVQLDLLGTATTPTLVKDELAWEAEGFLAGRRADEPTPPKGCTGENIQAFMRGYHLGQEENGLRLSRAEKLREAAATPQTAPPVDLTDPENEAELEDAVDKVKKSGFLQTSAKADDFEAGEDELAQQTTRRAVQDGRDGDGDATKPAAA